MTRFNLAPTMQGAPMTNLANAIRLEAEYQNFRRASGYGVERDVGRWLRAAFARQS